MEFKELHTIQNYKEYLSVMKCENLELNDILVSDIISVAKPCRRLLRWKDNIKMDLTQLN
jgi:DNA integrity scanning protein DisA with diadenylate cyclase activity